MNTSIFQSLKHKFIENSNVNNRSIVELSITELASGNFPKAVDISEELIKKDVNDSVGWALKALAQSHLFDYEEKLFFLKSSLASLEEFKKKTNLTSKEIDNVEAVFTILMLNKTIDLVNMRIEEVIELRKKALTEKAKARAAAFATVMSGYAASKSNSDVAKILGYGATAAGAIATATFDQNSNLLMDASKGVFGTAVANISMTINSAKTLHNNRHSIDKTIMEEANQTLQTWIVTLAFLYQEVVENFNVHCLELKDQSVLSKKFADKAVNLINSPEAVQFIYLSKSLGIQNTIPQYSELENQILILQKINRDDLDKSRKTMNYLIIGTISLGFIFGDAPPVGPILIFIGLIMLFLFTLFPLGKTGELKKLIKEVVQGTKKFKVTSENLIIENMQ